MIATEENIPHLTGQLPAMRLGIDHLTDDERIGYILSETANILDVVPNNEPRKSEQVEYRMYEHNTTHSTTTEAGRMFDLFCNYHPVIFGINFQNNKCGLKQSRDEYRTY
jgi:hypothetical protein